MDTLPDVVLEVDNTTDARRGKLRLYESWGFPEVWVEVPDEPEANRSRSLRPDLTIHLRGPGGFRTVPVSSAFPGWTAEEFHRALNELTLSDETAHVLNRVGTAMGAAQGTGPDDDPFLRRQHRASRRAGYAEGREREGGRRATPRGGRKGWTMAARKGCGRRCFMCSNREAFPSLPPCPNGSRRSKKSPPTRWCTRRWSVVTSRIFCSWPAGGCRSAPGRTVPEPVGHRSITPA